MKKLLCLLTLCALCLSVAPLAAKAEKVDMGSVTCKQLLEMDEAEITFMVFWYDGYFSAKTGNNTMDTDALEQALEALGEHCGKNPNDNVLKVLSQ